jgi:hypothetical protein
MRGADDVFQQITVDFSRAMQEVTLNAKNAFTLNDP